MTRIATGIVLFLAAAGSVIPRYFVSGFTHVIPHGLDHVLFILGLFLLNRSFAILLFQMTLFTLAHSLTLGLALYGIVSLPSSAVEIAIAVSISFIAIENLISRDRLSAWRPWVVFGFGLIHGLGFAHTFAGSPPAADEFLPALFSFNFGIECGQLAVIALAFGASRLVPNGVNYNRRIVIPACVMIAAAGILLAVQRVAGFAHF